MPLAAEHDMGLDRPLEIALDHGRYRRLGMSAKRIADVELLTCDQYLHDANGSARRGLGCWQHAKILSRAGPPYDPRPPRKSRARPLGARSCYKGRARSRRRCT